METLMTITRRDLLKGGVALATTAIMAGAAPQTTADAPPLPRVTAMSERVNLPLRTVGLPPVPPLKVIALNRMAFGPRPEDWAAYDALGPTPEEQFTAYVEQQLDPDAIDDSDCDARIAAQGFITLNKSLTELWADHREADEYSVRILPFTETRNATWIRALYSKRQLLEVLTDFWHNHFNIYAPAYIIASVWVHYDRDVIRTHALGNFRTFLEAVATSTAMLYYLDNYVNSNAGPNENYARELFELHTLGADHYLGFGEQEDVPGYDTGNPIGYVDDDIYEAARAFTGWRVRNSSSDPDIGNTGEFFTYEPWHDRFEKTVLGHRLENDRPALADGRDVLNLVASHPGTAQHVCKKLCRRFISDDPPQSVIDAAVATWNATADEPDQLKQVVRTILLSDEFKNTWGEKIKRPFEFVASLLRASGAEWVPSSSFRWNFRRLGQPLFQWPTPDGYPDRREPWIGTNAMLRRWNIVNSLIEGWVEGTTIDLRSQMPADIRSSNAIVDWWINRIMGRPINTDDRQEIVDFMAQGRN
ncbi:MAG TPA: DUF1800 family protein, partial [Anaerolineae bacterium]|nr:DUF1800 family protein [Anaerolineae bacterium]